MRLVTKQTVCIQLILSTTLVLPTITTFTKQNQQLLNAVQNEWTPEKTFWQNVLYIQNSFCPNQTYCPGDVNLPAHKVANNLSSPILDVDTWTFDYLSQIGSLCCFPCLCETKCYENGNCCLSKQISDNGTNTSSKPIIKSQCTAATIMAYKFTVSTLTYQHYYMVRQCFVDTSNNELISKCEHPDPYNIEEAMPVTSMVTSRTYWNIFCAMCNHDGNDVQKWNATYVIYSEYVYFNNDQQHNVAVLPSDLDNLYKLPLRQRDIIFNPTNRVSVSELCHPSDMLAAENSNIEKSGYLYENNSFKEACSSYISIVRHYKQVYKNVFCWFLNVNENNSPAPRLEDRRSCAAQVDRRFPSASIVGLLNTLPFKDDKQLELPPDLFGCNCRSFYDNHKQTCRPMQCPPGDAFDGCVCVPILATVSGIQVLSKVKIIPDVPSSFQTSEKFLKRMRHKAANVLGQYVNYTKIKPIAQYINTGENPYYLTLFTMVVQLGHDTKNTLFRLMLDMDTVQQFLVDKNLFKWSVTSEVNIWRDRNSSTSVCSLNAMDMINNKTKLKYVKTVNLISESKTCYVRFQEFSKLLYCRQVELTATEFTNDEGNVLVRANGNLVGLNYITVSSNVPSNASIRICVEDYKLTYRDPFRPISSQSSSLSVFACAWGYVTFLKVFAELGTIT